MMENKIKLTKKEKELLRHTLGLNYNPKSYRNHFAADPLTEDYRICLDLEEKGLMRQGRTNENKLVYFHATDAGRDAVL
jgi:hypothetical protein